MKANRFRIAVRKFPPFEAAMEKVWNRYCQASGCTLEADFVPMELHALYESLFEHKGLANGDWDVAHVNTDWIPGAYHSGAVADLRPFIESDPPDGFPSGWSTSLLGLQQFGDVIAGLPFHDGPECLIFRKDLFADKNEQERFRARFGRELKPPQTWDDFRDVARFFNRPEENLYGTVFAGFPDGHNTVFDFCLQLWSRGGDLLDKQGRINLRQSAAAEALDFYREFLNDRTAVHPGSAGFGSVEAGAAFARGEVALMINWFGFATVCEVDPESAVKGKVDISGIPAGRRGKQVSLNVYWLYTIGSGSRNKQAAYDFIRFAINEYNDKQLTLEGGIGCRLSTWNDSEINRKMPYYYKLEELHKQARTLPRNENWAAISSYIDRAVVQASTTNEPTGSLLRSAQAGIDLLAVNSRSSCSETETHGIKL